jgi:hypothetical protein
MKRFSNSMKFIFVVIAVGVAAIIALALYNHYSTRTINWSKTKDVFEVLKNVATIIAIGAGAVWAYFNFFKGRTYRSRLEPKVSGKVISHNGAYYLIVTAQLKNVGLSDVRIDQKGSALRVFALRLVNVHLRLVGLNSIKSKLRRLSTLGYHDYMLHSEAPARDSE